ncbi:HtaA domain-containing protein [Rhodococcus qingshengii]|uniref:HtaA domain-containing protein n=1 Tax=Rhodococcus qingshengii TaxID=334542 RepID=UPI001F12BA61|nr:HtaA domain-containing protein [Rhodococcus qingshengii]ULD45132.1 HtaA domain-containing protein [Rhodococcus qingshengii]
MTSTGSSSAFPRIGLTWGIKRSFIRYISYLPDGHHVVEEGAYLNDGSLFTFPISPAAVPDADEMRFQGTVRIGGHGGLLGVLLSDLWVNVSGDRGTLSVLDLSRWPTRRNRITLAELEVHRQQQDDGLVLHCAAALAEEGVSVFGGNYPQGTALDPVVVH